jgi:hydrogenase-4 component F
MLVLAIAAVAGLPPFALFASEFLLMAEVAARHAWLIAPLGLGLLVAAAAKIHMLQALCLGDPTPDVPGPPPGAALTLGPMAAHLLLAAVLGLALPEPLARLLREAARILA